MRDKPVAPPRPPSLVPETEFQHLVSQWQRATAAFPLLVDKLTHPSYMRIIGQGPAVVPLLIAELIRKPAHWGLALYAITGANPVRDEDAGDVDRIAAAWIAWGRENGY